MTNMTNTIKKQTAGNNQFLKNLKKQIAARALRKPIAAKTFKRLSALYNEKAVEIGLDAAEFFVNKKIDDENARLAANLEDIKIEESVKKVADTLASAKPFDQEEVEFDFTSIEGPYVLTMIDPPEQDTPKEVDPIKEKKRRQAKKDPIKEKKRRQAKKDRIKAEKIRMSKAGKGITQEAPSAPETESPVEPEPEITSAAPKTKTKKKNPGIIASIIKMLTTTTNGVTKDEILLFLKEEFPERAPEKMMATIKVQVPSRLRKDKGLNVIKIDDKFSIKS